MFHKLSGDNKALCVLVCYCFAISLVAGLLQHPRWCMISTRQGQLAVEEAQLDYRLQCQIDDDQISGL
jgi:hypothetical protein